MANYRAVYSVGSSIARFLQDNYAQEPIELQNSFPCSFRLVASADVATEDAHAMDQTVSIFLHRVTVNEQLRSVSQLRDKPTTLPTLFLDLHYLVTYWGASVEAEQTILTWVMQQLATFPILDSSILSGVAGWDADETVQLIPTNMTPEDILRIWDALGPKYRLSVSYIARVVRIDRTVKTFGPVVATRHELTRMGQP